MTRWIVFDDETAEAVVSRFKRGAAEIQTGNALSAALNLQRSCLLVLPSVNPDQVLLATLRPTSEVGEEPTVRYEPSGFLGLSDEPVFTRPKPPQTVDVRAKKPWWHLRRSA